MSSRPLVTVIFWMIVFWSILFAIWPTAVLIYFAITGSALALFALVVDVKRALDNWRP